jgi:hypothetical protein
MKLTHQQLDALKGLYAHCYHAKFDGGELNAPFWAEQLDRLEVPWFIQNLVADLAGKRESNAKYLTPQINKIVLEYNRYINRQHKDCKHYGFSRHNLKPRFYIVRIHRHYHVMGVIYYRSLRKALAELIDFRKQIGFTTFSYILRDAKTARKYSVGEASAITGVPYQW